MSRVAFCGLLVALLWGTPGVFAQWDSVAEKGVLIEEVSKDLVTVAQKNQHRDAKFKITELKLHIDRLATATETTRGKLRRYPDLSGKLSEYRDLTNRLKERADALNSRVERLEDLSSSSELSAFQSAYTEWAKKHGEIGTLFKELFQEIREACGRACS